MIKLAVGLAVGTAFLVACDSGHPDGTGSTGSSGSGSTGGTTTGVFLAGGVSTLAGVATLLGSTDGPPNQARFDRPQGVAQDSNGNYFVADTNNNSVRMIDPAGNVTTLSDTASFYEPTGVAIDAQDTLYIAVAQSYQIWKRTAADSLSIVAGKTEGYVDGLGGSGDARFVAPAGIAVDKQGNLYVSDANRIRKIDTSFNVTTLAGNGDEGLVNGTGTATGQAEFTLPRGLAVDAAGNVYVADTGNSVIRKIDPSGNVSTLAGNGMPGELDGSAANAEFDRPSGVAVDANGNVFVTDSGNNVIRRIDSAGNVSTWAGSGNIGYGDSPAPLEAQFANPFGLALTLNGGLVVTDQINSVIRLIGP